MHSLKVKKDLHKIFNWKVDSAVRRDDRKLLLERFGLDGNAKALSVNDDWRDWVSIVGEDQDTDAFPDKAKEFRAAVARLGYLVRILPMFDFQQRSYLRRCWRRLENVVRFLVGRKRVVWRFPWQSVEEAAQLKVITDANWSGDKRSRKSASGGAAMRSEHFFEDVAYHTEPSRCQHRRRNCTLWWR